MILAIYAAKIASGQKDRPRSTMAAERGLLSEVRENGRDGGDRPGAAIAPFPCEPVHTAPAGTQSARGGKSARLTCALSNVFRSDVCRHIGPRLSLMGGRAQQGTTGCSVQAGRAVDGIVTDKSVLIAAEPMGYIQLVPTPGNRRRDAGGWGTPAGRSTSHGAESRCAGKRER